MNVKKFSLIASGMCLVLSLAACGNTNEIEPYYEADNEPVYEDEYDDEYADEGGYETETEDESEAEEETVTETESDYVYGSADRLADVDLEEKNIGDTVSFGAFEQDNNEGNGAEAIEWIILSKEDGKALLISKDVLEYKPFEDDAMEADWESCSLRKWLNGEFYDNSFSDEDKLRFSAGEDAVFCLSLEEAQMYFGEYDLYSEANNCGYKIGYLCSPSEYAKRISHYSHWQIADEYNGLDSHTNPEGGDYLTMIDIYGDKLDDLDGKIIVAWWLRSQGGSGFSACYVSSNGFVGADNWLEMSDENHIGVRPAIYVTY